MARYFVILALWYLAAEIGAAAPAEGWRPCPPNQQEVGLTWVYSPEGDICTSLAPSFGRSVAVRGLNPCDSAAWQGFGGAGEIGILASSSQARDIAGLLPGNTTACVALRGTAGVWSWVSGNSSYGLTSGPAWVGGAVPAASPTTCAVLTHTGLLAPVPCSANVSISAAVCQIPACPCPDLQSCTTSTALPSWDGYACAPLRPAPQITSVHFFEGHEMRYGTVDDQSNGEDAGFQQGDPLSAAAGYGTAIDSYADLEALFSTLSMLPGDAIRICGTFDDGDLVNEMRMFMVRPVLIRRPAVYDLQYAIGRNGEQCKDFQMPRNMVEAFDLNGVLVIADGSNARQPNTNCAVLAVPAGTAICWGAKTGGDPKPLLAGPSAGSEYQVLSALYAGWGTWCSLPTTSCTGDPLIRVPIEEEDFFYSVGAFLTSVSVGSDHVCAVRRLEYAQGKAWCWGANDLYQSTVPSDLGGVASVCAGVQYSCAMLDGSRRVRCWGLVLQLWGAAGTPFPPSAHLSCGLNRACVVVMGTGKVECRGESAADVFVPDGLPPAMAISASVTGRGSCIISTEGKVLCWGQADIARVPDDLSPAVSVSLGTAYACAVVVLPPSMAGQSNVRCWGDGREGDLEVPPSIRAPLPTDRSIASIKLGSFAHNFYVSLTAPMLMTELSWEPTSTGGEKVVLRRRKASRWGNSSQQLNSTGTDTIIKSNGYEFPSGTLPHLYVPLPGQSAPLLYMITQAGPTTPPTRSLCTSWDIVSAYEVWCTSPSYLWGVEVRVWDGERYVTRGYRRPSALAITAGQRYATASELGVFAPTINVTALQMSLSTAHAALWNTSYPADAGGSMQLWAVRPGDTISVLGTGFGVDASLQQVPWWSAINGTGILRSCIHLAWWASPAAYHNASACVCNGLEDWLGEGELPLSAITAWNDTYISFIVPTGEGIREVRPCIEGVSTPSGVPGGLFLAWEPPSLLDLLPSRYSDTTEQAQEIRLQVSQAKTRDEAYLEHWGVCGATYPMPAGEYGSQLRHCTTAVLVQDSLGSCYAVAGLPTVLPSWPADTASLLPCTPSLRPQLFTGDSTATDTLTQGSTHMFTLPVPQPVANAVLNMSFHLFMWDGGVTLRSLPALSSMTYRRTPPILRAVAPNPLLLAYAPGPQASNGTTRGGGQQVLLTLYGPGLRTREEILDPRNGLLGLPSTLRVFVDGVECTEAAVQRTDRFAFATCVYPQEALGGGVHNVSMELLGMTTSLTSGDGASASLQTACASGHYGMFGVQGHQLCLPCPQGGLCAGGVGQVPLATAGFYNLGRLPRAAGATVTALPARLGVQAEVGALCPPGMAHEGRDIACVVPCEPAAACLDDNVCSEGYESAAPTFRCATCRRGFYRTGGICTTCPPSSLLSMGLVLLSAIALAALLYVLTSNSVKMTAVFLVLEYAQVMSLLYGPTHPWPPAVGKVLQVFSLARLNFELTSPDCVYGLTLSPDAKLGILIMLPVLALALASAAAVFFRILKLVTVASSSAEAAAVGGMQAKVQAALGHARWPFAHFICRNTLKLVDILYLPGLLAILEVWNCTPTTPPDGKEYLSIVFEECGLPGGVQERMKPVAYVGLVLYGLLYPVAVSAFFVRNAETIMEDQLLRAAGTGFTASTNPRGYRMRKYALPLYVHFKPGYHYMALFTLARRAAVCSCSLLLNKSPILTAAMICFIMATCTVIELIYRPLLTPGHGYAQAVSLFLSVPLEERSAAESRVFARVSEIVEDVTRPAGVVGQAAPSAQGGKRWRRFPWMLDWNHLAVELQLQVVLTSQLSILYGASQGTVYAASLEGTVTALFFLLQCVATCHVGLTVGYDLLLQARDAMRAHMAGVDSSAAPPDAAPDSLLALLAEVVELLLALMCCRYSAWGRRVRQKHVPAGTPTTAPADSKSRGSRVQAVLVSGSGSSRTVTGSASASMSSAASAGTPTAVVADWTLNPVKASGSSTPPPVGQP